jgi:serine/threonine protein kinase
MSQIHADESYTVSDVPPGPDFDLGFKIDDKLPQYSSKEILILEVFVSGGGAVSRVQVDGQEMLCKARREGLADQSLERELANLSKIGEAYSTIDKTFRVARLRGYVRHASSGAIIGLLREWIPNGTRGRTLTHVDILSVPTVARQKWETQIRETVDWLHSIGIVWGDGKPSNVVIDQDEQAWLIDFAGGWTEGLVDFDLADTVEGDGQAVENIVRFLDL